MGLTHPPRVLTSFPAPPLPGQVPRLYNLYKEQGLLENFEQLLENIFTPLFEVGEAGVRRALAQGGPGMLVGAMGVWGAVVVRASWSDPPPPRPPPTPCSLQPHHQAAFFLLPVLSSCPRR